MSRKLCWLAVAALLLPIVGCTKETKPGVKAKGASSDVRLVSNPNEGEPAVTETPKPGVLDRIGSVFGSKKKEEKAADVTVTVPEPQDVPPTVPATGVDAASPPKTNEDPPPAVQVVASAPASAATPAAAPVAQAPVAAAEAGRHWAFEYLDKALAPFSRKQSEYWWVWILVGWLVFSIAAASVLEGVQPWNRPNDTMLLGHRIRLDEKSHPFAAGALFYIPIVWFCLANRESLPSVGFTRFAWVIGIAIATVLVILAGWSMGIRWKLHIHFDFWEPFRQVRRMWLIKSKQFPESSTTKETQVPPELVAEWSQHWRAESKRLGVSYNVPSYLNNKALIAEWTFLFPLSVQHVIWVMFVRNGFWFAVDSLAAIPRWTESDYKQRLEGQLLEQHELPPDASRGRQSS